MLRVVGVLEVEPALDCEGGGLGQRGGVFVVRHDAVRSTLVAHDIAWVRGFGGGTEFSKVPVGPERPQNCNMSHV